METPKALAVSDRLYRLLLFIYPTTFREEYGPHMAQLFRDQCRDAYGESGVKGVVRLWMTAVFDLAKTAVSEYIWEASHMTNGKKLTSQELLVVLTPLLVFFFLFIINPRYVGQLLAIKEPFIIAPIFPWGWLVTFLAGDLIFAAYYFFGIAHDDTTAHFKNAAARYFAILLLLLATMLILLGPAWLQVTRAIN